MHTREKRLRRINNRRKAALKEQERLALLVQVSVEEPIIELTEEYISPIIEEPVLEKE
jgi:hypothetical protein